MNPYEPPQVECRERSEPWWLSPPWQVDWQDVLLSGTVSCAGMCFLRAIWFALATIATRP